MNTHITNSAREYRKFIRQGVFWGIMLHIVIPILCIVTVFGLVLFANKTYHKEATVENYYYSTQSSSMPKTAPTPEKEGEEVKEAASASTPTEAKPGERSPEERQIQEDLERTLRHQ